MNMGKLITVAGKEYIRYAGTHDELYHMLKVGDLVTLRRQDAANVESVKVIGTVTEINGVVVTVSVAGGTRDYVTGRQSSEPPFLYAVTAIKRPVENELPNCGGLWRDRDENTWVIENGTLDGQCVERAGNWILDRPRRIKPEAYAYWAPFTKITFTEDAGA